MADTARKLRFTTIITAMTYGGAQRIVIDLHRVMPACIEPDIICLYPGGMARFIREMGVPIVEWDLRGARSLLALPQLLRRWRARRPDIVMTHLGYADFVGRVAAHLVGVPLVLSVCHNIEDWREKRLYAFLDRVSGRWADGILCISKAAREHMIAKGHDPSRLRISHGRGELRDRFRSTGLEQSKAAALRASLNIPGDALISVMVGRLFPQKAHDVMLDALKRLHQTAPGMPHVVLIAGDGPDRQKLEAQAARDLPASVYRFLGNRDDVPDLLGLADVFLLPSRWEGTPLALQEAFAAGLPALVSDIPSMSEVVDDCGGAVLFPSGDASAMASAWLRLLNDPALRADLAGKGRENALAHWDIRNLRDEYFKFIAELACRPGCFPEGSLPRELLDYRNVETFCH